MSRTDADRLGIIDQALALYPEDDREATIVDLMADLMLYCDARGHDAEALLDWARAHYLAESHTPEADDYEPANVDGPIASIV